MNHQLKPMPEPVKEDWDKYDLESCVTEVRNLRHFVASLFMQVKEWTSRMNDLAAASEQILKLKGDDESKYIALSNTAQFLTDQTMDLSNKVASLLVVSRKVDNLGAGLEIAHNTLNELDENITLIMDFLEMSGDEIAPDDTPQPPY